MNNKSNVRNLSIIALALVIITVVLLFTMPTIMKTPNQKAIDKCFERDGIPLMQSKDSEIMRECLTK